MNDSTTNNNCAITQQQFHTNMIYTASLCLVVGVVAGMLIQYKTKFFND